MIRQIIRPVKAGRDDARRQADGQRVPPEVASAEDGDDISGQPVEKFGHARLRIFSCA